jgi:hypothetical protein
MRPATSRISYSTAGLAPAALAAKQRGVTCAIGQDVSYAPPLNRRSAMVPLVGKTCGSVSLTGRRGCVGARSVSSSTWRSAPYGWTPILGAGPVRWPTRGRPHNCGLAWLAKQLSSLSNSVPTAQRHATGIITAPKSILPQVRACAPAGGEHVWLVRSCNPETRAFARQMRGRRRKYRREGCLR